MQDPYEVLDVPSDASQDDIKKAYRELAKKWHPDRHFEKDAKAAAETKFKDISSAYELVNTPEKRKRHEDRMDPYAAFESGGWGGMDGLFRREKPRGRNLRILLELELEEIARGVSHKIELNRVVECESCGASGAKDGKMTACGTCHGSGVVSQEQRRPGVVVVMQGRCPSCNGQGQWPVTPCPGCEGRGLVEEKEVLEVPVPAGVGQAQLLRIPGKGEQGPGGYGDLYVVVRSKPHQRFKRDRDDDLTTSLEVPFLIAMRGGKMDIKGLLGDTLWVDVPRACQYGHWAVFPGKGLNGGSLKVRLTFQLPELSNTDLDRLSELTASN